MKSNSNKVPTALQALLHTFDLKKKKTNTSKQAFHSSPVTRGYLCESSNPLGQLGFHLRQRLRLADGLL